MGGHIFNNTAPVRKDDIIRIIDLIESNTNFRRLSTRLLGSALKKDTSNDVDIAIAKYEVPIIIEYLDKHGFEYKNHGSTIHAAIVLDSVPRQVDFMVGSIDWLKFYYFSAGLQSNFTGNHRAILLRSVAKNIGTIVSPEIDSFDRPTATERWKFGPKGLIRVVRESIYNGGRWLKTQHDREISELYNDPKVVKQILFSNAKADAGSVESIIQLINSRKEKNMILSDFVNGLPREDLHLLDSLGIDIHGFRKN